MPRLTRKMPAEIPQACTKSDAFTIKWSDIPNMVDAVFDADHKMPGWVLMFASAKGCGHVDDLFPEEHIEWHELPPGLPDDWRHMRVNLPQAVSASPNALLTNPLRLRGCSQAHIISLPRQRNIGWQADSSRRSHGSTKRTPLSSTTHESGSRDCFCYLIVATAMASKRSWQKESEAVIEETS